MKDKTGIQDTPHWVQVNDFTLSRTLSDLPGENDNLRDFSLNYHTSSSSTDYSDELEMRAIRPKQNRQTKRQNSRDLSDISSCSLCSSVSLVDVSRVNGNNSDTSESYSCSCSDKSLRNECGIERWRNQVFSNRMINYNRQNRYKQNLKRSTSTNIFPSSYELRQVRGKEFRRTPPRKPPRRSISTIEKRSHLKAHISDYSTNSFSSRRNLITERPSSSYNKRLNSYNEQGSFQNALSWVRKSMDRKHRRKRDITPAPKPLTKNETVLDTNKQLNLNLETNTSNNISKNDDITVKSNQASSKDKGCIIIDAIPFKKDNETNKANDNFKYNLESSKEKEKDKIIKQNTTKNNITNKPQRIRQVKLGNEIAQRVAELEKNSGQKFHSSGCTLSRTMSTPQNFYYKKREGDFLLNRKPPSEVLSSRGDENRLKMNQKRPRRSGTSASFSFPKTNVVNIVYNSKMDSNIIKRIKEPPIQPTIINQSKNLLDVIAESENIERQVTNNETKEIPQSHNFGNNNIILFQEEDRVLL